MLKLSERVGKLGDEAVARALEKVATLTAECQRLTSDVASNAAMLARQCDLAREAENRATQAEQQLAALEKLVQKMGDAAVVNLARAEQADARLTALQEYVLHKSGCASANRNLVYCGAGRPVTCLTTVCYGHGSKCTCGLDAHLTGETP